MAKNMKKRETVTSVRQSNFIPDFHHIDDLAVMPDEELSSVMHGLDAMREKVIAGKGDPTACEIEICYVRREMQQRWTRRDAHAAYMRENSYAGEDEAYLPAADFDNSQFMVN